jgi:hypothetical protein
VQACLIDPTFQGKFQTQISQGYEESFISLHCVLIDQEMGP